MALVPVVPMTIAAAIIDPEHTVDTTNNSADSRTNGSADRTTDRSSCAIATISTFIGAAFHSPDHALRMRGHR